MKTENQEKPDRKLQIFVSETSRGITIREKLGHIVLWKKEMDNRNGIYVVEIRKLICKSCGHLIELAFPKKIFKMLGEAASHAETCDSCQHVNEYNFGAGQEEVAGIITKQVRSKV